MDMMRQAHTNMGDADRDARSRRQLALLRLEPWLEALEYVGQHYRLSFSRERVRNGLRWSDQADEAAAIRQVAQDIGLNVRPASVEVVTAGEWNLPVIVRLIDGRIGVVNAIGANGDASVVFCGDQGLPSPIGLDRLIRDIDVLLIPRPARTVPDRRIDAYIRPFRKNWMRRIMFHDMRPYVHIMIASLIANALGLAGILFSMQVYDRVIPAESFHTLAVLFSGVLLAIGFDFLLRRLRMNIIDILGKRSDVMMSDHVFGHALRIKNRLRPASTGTFIAQLRDLEQVRDLLTSTTVSALADLPFFLLFLAIFWHIGGIMVLVPLGALVVMIVPGLLAQHRIKAHASEAMRESSLRNAMLVEAVQGIEDIKTLQAEERFQQQWNHFNTVAGDAQLKARGLTNTLNVWTHNVQVGVYALTIFIGAPMVIAGDLTTGALVGVSVLGSRMMAPMAQLTQVFSRLQHARIAMKSLNQLMQMEVDHPPEESRIHLPRIAGHFRLISAVFKYGEENVPALTVKDLTIRPGEKIAVLGRNGAGKSTLLQALSGLLEASAGDVLLDSVAMAQIDPADLRRDVNLLTQNARLFYGTIRENITLGAAHASEDDILKVLAMVGADAFIRKVPKGLEHVLMEGGLGLSGGQRQALLLARLLIRQPSVLLLDEPTASMDEATERQFIRDLLVWGQGRTIVICTHRMRVLDLVDRVIVVDGGAIVLDGAKDTTLQKLRVGVTPPAKARGAALPT
ncbi:ATP-binding cassette subfamily C protein LapB [Rhizobium sp. PP-CC-3A-592]|nr:ATP-binding cassette subfamily C protein LapB [Rhizobium sp. PP-CC-3A-592]